MWGLRQHQRHRRLTLTKWGFSGPCALNETSAVRRSRQNITSTTGVEGESAHIANCRHEPVLGSSKGGAGLGVFCKTKQSSYQICLDNFKLATHRRARISLFLSRKSRRRNPGSQLDNETCSPSPSSAYSLRCKSLAPWSRRPCPSLQERLCAPPDKPGTCQLESGTHQHHVFPTFREKNRRKTYFCTDRQGYLCSTS